MTLGLIPLVGLEVGLLTVALTAAACAFTLTGLGYGWHYTLGWLMRKIGNGLVGLSLGAWKLRGHPLAPLGRRVLTWEQEVRKLLFGGAEALSGKAMMLWEQSWKVLQSLGAGVEWVSQSLADLTGRVLDHDIPKARTEAAREGAATATQRARGMNVPLQRELVRTRQKVGRLERHWSETLERHEREINRIKTRRLPRVERQARVARDTARNTARRVESKKWWQSKLWWLGGSLFFAGAVGRALTRNGLGWLRCRNVGRIGRRLCGFPTDVLEALLGVAVVAFTLSNLCRLVGWIQTAAWEFEPLLIAFVNEVQGLVCGGKESAPSGIVESDWERVTLRPSGIANAEWGSRGRSLEQKLAALGVPVD